MPRPDGLWDFSFPPLETREQRNRRFKREREAKERQRVREADELFKRQLAELSNGIAQLNQNMLHNQLVLQRIAVALEKANELPPTRAQHRARWKKGRKR